jgi:prepilin-type processing-associated H-X9-DG protein
VPGQNDALSGSAPFLSPGNGFGGCFWHLLPFIEQQNVYNLALCSSPAGARDCENCAPNWGAATELPIKVYLCPSDPTSANGNPGVWLGSVGSYCYNGMIFKMNWPRLLGGVYQNSLSSFPASISDGTSNTIFFTEQYAGANPLFPNGNDALWFSDLPAFQAPAGSNSDCGNVAGPNLVGPAYLPLIAPPVTYCTSNTWSNGFSACLCRATSPHTGGINAAMGDGSVHFVAQGISGGTWFYACTPANGDILGSDW